MNKKFVSSDTIDLFVNQLIEEKAYDSLDEEVLSQIKSDLHNRVEDHINAVILEKMPPDKMEEFEKIVQTSEAPAIQKYCQQNIPNLNEVVAAQLLAFRQTYLNP